MGAASAQRTSFEPHRPPLAGEVAPGSLFLIPPPLVARRRGRDEDPRRHVWTAPCRQGFFGVSANGSGSGHVYGLEIRPVAAGPDGERGSNSNHCGALLRAMTARSVSIPVS